MISNTHTAVTNYARDLFAPKNVNAPKWHFYINLTFKYIILKKTFSKETYKKKSLRWKPSKDRMRMGSQKERKRIEKGWSSLSSSFFYPFATCFLFVWSHPFSILLQSLLGFQLLIQYFFYNQHIKQVSKYAEPEKRRAASLYLKINSFYL